MIEMGFLLLCFFLLISVGLSHVFGYWPEDIILWIFSFPKWLTLGSLFLLLAWLMGE